MKWTEAEFTLSSNKVESVKYDPDCDQIHGDEWWKKKHWFDIKATGIIDYWSDIDQHSNTVSINSSVWSCRPDIWNNNSGDINDRDSSRLIIIIIINISAVYLSISFDCFSSLVYLAFWQLPNKFWWCYLAHQISIGLFVLCINSLNREEKHILRVFTEFVLFMEKMK